MIPNLGTLCTTHVGHKRFIKASLECVQSLKPKIRVCSYNINNGYMGYRSLDPLLPQNDVMVLADKWIISSNNTHIGAWAWLHLAGIEILASHETDYVFALEGDCAITKPEGLQSLYDRLIDEGGDIICAERRGPTHAGPVSYLAKTSVIKAVMENFIANRENPLLSGGGPEGRFGAAINELGFKCLDIKNPENSHFSYGDKGTWGDVLGFLHMHGAEKWRMGHNYHPLPKFLYDVRNLPPAEAAALEIYWQTGRTDHLVAAGYWWPKPIINNEIETGD
jgi:hypothetical protein